LETKGEKTLQLVNFRFQKMNFQKLDDAREEIRMLTILPSDDPSRSIHCELHTVSFSDYTPSYRSHISAHSFSMPQEALTSWIAGNPTSHHPSITDTNNAKAGRFIWGDFAALSYTWGDPQDKHDITVNGHLIQVTSNLAAALLAFRFKGYFEPGGMKIWIDAICINQEDIVERGLEVKKMGLIYGSAWNVISWLGPEKDNSNKALELLEILAPYENQDGESNKLVDLLGKDPEYLGSGRWLALYHLVERPYWARLWVIQEIVLAASDVVMICGDQRIMWSTLRNGINMIGRYLYTTKNVLLDYERKKVGLRPMHSWDSLNFHHTSRGIGGMTVWRQEGKESTVEQLLYVADRSLATDPKDRVYELLGMLPSSLSERITPDYKLNTGDVFISAAKAFIQHYGNLEILREGKLWGNHARPSWAPDWTAGFHGREADLPRPYNAGDGKLAKFSFGGDGIQLTCSGYILDRIDGLGAQQDGYDWEWLPQTIVQPSNRVTIYGDFASTKVALYTVLIGDRGFSGAKASRAHDVILNLPSDSKKAIQAFQKLGWTDMILEGK
jgi:hypothetical protein